MDQSTGGDANLTAKKRRNRRRAASPVRMVDVASRAGVSTGSVSRTLNEPTKVAAKTRAKVLQAAEELGWVPHGAARSLASHRSRTIGAIIPTLANVVFADVMNTTQRRLLEDGYILVIGCSEYDPEQAYLQLWKLIERGVDGVILLGENFTERFWSLLRSRKIPYVVTYSLRAESTRPCVGCDNYRAFARLTQYLVDQGHKRFGIVAQDSTNNDRAEARLRGALDVLTECGLAPLPGHVVKKEWSIAQGREGLRQILKTKPRPTALLCVNDDLALGAMAECQELGLSIPGEMSIAGFDDIEVASHLQPALTTVHMPTQALGIKTAEHLIARLAKKRFSKRTELEAELIVRGSTGPCPRRPRSG